MGRKSSDLDKKMVEAGIALIKERGVAKLSVREVAELAGANLGMFNYHFGTKEKFLIRALTEVYDKFIGELTETVETDSDLELVLFQLAKFSRDNREILTSILSDMLSNEAVVSQFLRKNFSKHFKLLAASAQKHVREQGHKIENHHHVVRYLVGAVGIPNILLEVYNRGTSKKINPETDEELRRRTKAAIAGLGFL